MARQRLGTEPRSVLGAPLILANKDLQGDHIVSLISQIVMASLLH